MNANLPPFGKYNSLSPLICILCFGSSINTSSWPYSFLPYFFVHYSIFLLSQNACLVLKVLKIPSIFYFDFIWVFLELEGTWYYFSTMGILLKFYIDSVAKGVIVWVRDHHWWIGALGSWVFVCYMVLRVCFGLVCVS